MSKIERTRVRRIVIASADTKLRSALSIVAERAGLEIAGYVRAQEQVLDRALRLSPDTILIDAQLIREGDALITKLARALPKTKLLVYGGNMVPLAVVRPCLESGRMPHLLKVDAGDSNDFQHLRATLSMLLPATSGKERSVLPRQQVSLPACATPGRTRVPSAKRVFKMLVVASSTGGPEALTALMKMLPSDFPLPIAVVQHMPPHFTTMLAQRLNSVCALEVEEATDHMDLVPGRVIIGPGDFHIKVSQAAGRCRIELDSGERECSCRPSANVLFRSAADVFGGNVLTLVLTGMGRDGFDGARHLRELGSRIIVQDEATSTVWGMPGAIAQAGLADAVLPLTDIADELMRSVWTR